jgi:hypothetical protein
MKTTFKRRVLADLLEVQTTDAVLNEILSIFTSAAPRIDLSTIVHAYRTLEDLYGGAFPGYRSCNTGYHDLNHAVHTFLAMARLIQGATAAAEKMTDREILLALIAAAFHDAGYIQALEDRKGTGAKYKTGHEQRSIDWLDRHAAVLGLTPNDVRSVACLIRCTDMSTNIGEVPFTHGSKELLGRMLAGADLLAQLSEPVYLEKLLLLHKENLESGERRYGNEIDTLRKADEFYEFFKRHLAQTLPQAERFLMLHFETRWNIRDNLYREAITRQHAYLSTVLQASEESILTRLRRRRTLKALSGLGEDSGSD